MKIKESEKRQISGPCQRTKKAMEYEDDGDTKGFEKGLRGIANQWKNQDHPDNSIVETSQNISRNLWRLVVTQTTVKDHQLKLMLKKLARSKL